MTFALGTHAYVNPNPNPDPNPLPKPNDYLHSNLFVVGDIIARAIDTRADDVSPTESLTRKITFLSTDQYYFLINFEETPQFFFLPTP